MKTIIQKLYQFQLAAQRKQFVSTDLCSKIWNLNTTRQLSQTVGPSLTNCWKCQKSVSKKNYFFCSDCESLQDAEKNLDYFKLLNIESKFNIDSIELTKKFRQLQSLVHPDKYGNRSEREQLNSQEWSSLINKAYKTLLTPLDRGQYILKLNNIEMPQDNSTLNKEFLLEMMERNEEVDDASDNKSSLVELLQNVQRDKDIEAKELEKSFSEKQFEKSKFILVKMKYLRSLEKSIKDKIEKLLII